MASDEDELALLARSFDEHVDLFADHGLVLFPADASLELHEPSRALPREAARDLVVEGVAVGARLVRVVENAHPIERGPFDEAVELFEVLVRFTRMADDERG